MKLRKKKRKECLHIMVLLQLHIPVYCFYKSNKYINTIFFHFSNTFSAEFERRTHNFTITELKQ